jgi:hypothetical protein
LRTKSDIKRISLLHEQSVDKIELLNYKQVVSDVVEQLQLRCSPAVAGKVN